MIVVPWGIWSVVFYRRMRKADALQEYGRQVQIIRSGSVLDFLIGLPAHLYARNSGECCADVYTFMGLSLGIALAALTFGPAFFFLLIGRCRKQRAKYQPAKSTIRQSP